jgi:hypothetical protein
MVFFVSKSMLLSMFNSALVALSLCAVAITAQTPEERTIIDNIRGGFYTSPAGGVWNNLGIAIGTKGYNYSQMAPEALKGIHSRLQHFERITTMNYSYFPMELLDAYEADEVRQGRPPIWCTVTYQGVKKRLVFSWHYKQWGDSQPVNLRDDRFIKFFIKQYVRGVLEGSGRDALQNWVVGLDNFNFYYNLYGVDNNGQYVGVTGPWDKPFPQNQDEWCLAVIYCLDKMKEWAPDIRLIANEGSSPAKYDSLLFSKLEGVIHEGYSGESDIMSEDIIMPRKNLIQVFQTDVNASDPNDVRKRYIQCLVPGGKNWFFNCQVTGGSTEMDPALYTDFQSQLGDPIAPAQRLSDRIVRQCQGGSAWALNNGGTGYSLTVPDLRCAKVTINPRRPGTVTGPLALTMATFTSGATIRYTTNGDEPTASSLQYSGPVSINASCVVKAKAFKTGVLESFVNSATYTITSEPPAVEFWLAADSASEFLPKDYPLVALSHAAAQQITVAYQVTGGTATAGQDYTLAAGTVTFKPGDRYRFFPLTIIDDQNNEPWETIQITLSSPVNATLGTKKTYTYTIQDNDGGGPVALVRQIATARGSYDISAVRTASALRIEGHAATADGPMSVALFNVRGCQLSRIGLRAMGNGTLSGEMDLRTFGAEPFLLRFSSKDRQWQQLISALPRK